RHLWRCVSICFFIPANANLRTADQGRGGNSPGGRVGRVLHRSRSLRAAVGEDRRGPRERARTSSEISVRENFRFRARPVLANRLQYRGGCLVGVYSPSAGGV